MYPQSRATTESSFLWEPYRDKDVLLLFYSLYIVMHQVSPQWSPFPHVERLGQALPRMAMDFLDIIKVDLEVART
jgi:hypothetical protein